MLNVHKPCVEVVLKLEGLDWFSEALKLHFRVDKVTDVTEYSS